MQGILWATPVYFGAVTSKNSMSAMTTLIKEVQLEANNEVDLRNGELLEFPMMQS